MSKNLFSSDYLTIQKIRNTKNIEVGEKEELFKESNLPTFTLRHKEYPSEYVYIIYNVISQNGQIIKDLPTMEDDCENMEFVEIENHFEPIPHLIEAFKDELGVTFKEW